MDKLRFLTLLLFALGIMTSAEAQNKQKVESFLTDDEVPDGVFFLPGPPVEGSPEYDNDISYYIWGKEQRNTPAGKQAAIDEDSWTSTAFSPAVGFTIDPKETPEIFKLVEGARKDANDTNKRIKSYYKRQRPFAHFNEPSLVVKNDEAERNTYSYPSSHSVRGWVYAMTLALCVPDSTEALMLRARQYALYRVICGRHYKSDIDASQTVASAVFCKLVANKAFQKQLKKARKEYRRIQKRLLKEQKAPIPPRAVAQGVVVNRQRNFPKTVPPGNYSGIAWLGGSRYAVVNDKAKHAGFHLMNIDIDQRTGDILSVRADSFLTDGQRARDEEGICFVSPTNTLFVSSEKDGQIAEYSIDGKPTGRSLQVPEAFQTAYYNYGLEALTYNASTHRFWTTSENTLRKDGKRPTLANRLNNHLRLQSFGDNLLPAEQYLYESDPITTNKRKGESVLGVGGLAALDDGRLVVLEREVFIPSRKLGSSALVKLYVVDPSKQQPGETLKKELLAQFRTKINLTKRSFANYEGICVGPKLADGRQLLILVSDSQNHYRGLLKDWFRTVIIE